MPGKRQESVDLVIWSAQDRYVVALHSTKPRGELPTADWQQNIKIWDSRTGELLRTLRIRDENREWGHTNLCVVADMHPLDPRILLTAGTKQLKAILKV